MGLSIPDIQGSLPNNNIFLYFHFIYLLMCTQIHIPNNFKFQKLGNLRFRYIIQGDCVTHVTQRFENQYLIFKLGYWEFNFTINTMLYLSRRKKSEINNS